MQKSIMPILTLVSLLILTSLLVNAQTQAAAPSASENSWVTKPSMNVARSYLGVASVNGKIYAIGGINVPSVLDIHHTGPLPVSTNPKIVGTNEQYDPSTNIWSSKAEMPIAMSYFATASFGNDIYCIGGLVNEVYYTQNESWATKKPMPVSEIGRQANVVDGKIYVIGSSNYVYDPAIDNWTKIAQMPTVANGAFCSCVYNNEIYVFGSPFIQIYNPKNESWTAGAQIPVRMNQPVAAVTSGLDAPSRIYVFDESIVAVFDPQTSSWRAGAVLPAVQTNPNEDVGRVLFDHRGYGVVISNDLIYVVGGESITVSKEYVNSTVYPWAISELAINRQYVPFGYGSISPEISITSPRNTNYTSNNITLTFTVNKAVNWVGYSLDGQQNVTLSGNNTMANLANGSHNITLYANDTFRNIGSSQTINFNVENPTINASIPPQLLLVIIVVPIVIVCIAAALLYTKKHKAIH